MDKKFFIDTLRQYGITDNYSLTLMASWCLEIYNMLVNRDCLRGKIDAKICGWKIAYVLAHVYNYGYYLNRKE